MTDRVLHYYQAITDPAFAKYMIDQTGLSPQLQEIAWDFRNYQGGHGFLRRPRPDAAETLQRDGGGHTYPAHGRAPQARAHRLED